MNINITKEEYDKVIEALEQARVRLNFYGEYGRAAQMSESLNILDPSQPWVKPLIDTILIGEYATELQPLPDLTEPTMTTDYESHLAKKFEHELFTDPKVDMDEVMVIIKEEVITATGMEGAAFGVAWMGIKSRLSKMLNN